MLKFIIYNFILFSFILIFNIYYISCEDENSIVFGTLETENSDLLDITDNHNLNLVITSTKKIYKDWRKEYKF